MSATSSALSGWTRDRFATTGPAPGSAQITRPILPRAFLRRPCLSNNRLKYPPHGKPLQRTPHLVAWRACSHQIAAVCGTGNDAVLDREHRGSELERAGM